MRRSYAAMAIDSHRRDRRRGHRDFRVVPESRDGESTFVVVAPSGVALYSFTELNAATSEAAALNASADRDT